MKRTVSLLLCLVLLLGILVIPAGAIDTNTEAEPVPEDPGTRKFDASNRPIVYLNPDLLLTSMTPEDVTIYSISSGCMLNEARFYRTSGGDPLESDENFQLGESYMLIFQLKAKGSESFVNGVSAQVDFGEFESTAECMYCGGSYAIFVYYFPNPAMEAVGMYLNPFVDIKKGSYYYEAVLWAYNQYPVIVAGTDETHFSPNKACTRDQVVTFLWRALKRPEPIGIMNPFEDVKSGVYYYNAVLWAYYHNPQITSGTDDNHFSPKHTCTRAQVVTFLWRAKGRPAVSGSNPFKDVKSSDYYYQAVLWAVKNGITAGTDDTHFSPKNPCTRAQIVKFLYNAYGPKG